MAPKLPVLRKKDTTPARQVTGTSYRATGAPAVQPPDFSEIGSSKSTPIRDPVPELTNRRQASLVYKRMVRTDASVRVSLRAGKTPVLAGDFYIDAFDEQDQNQAIAEFVDFNLYHAMTTPWLHVLENICHFFEDGFAMFEPVYELREWAPKKTSAGANRRQYTMLRKLAVRPASQLAEFLYDDNGGPTGIKYNAIDSNNNSKEVEIPIEKLMIFTFDRDGGNLEGNSILRSAYSHWFYKDLFYRIDGIQKERHSLGIPKIRLMAGYKKKDVDAAWELVTNLRTNEKAGMVYPPNMEVDFAEIHGNVTDPLESANHHDNMIMKNVMVQFLNMGIEGSGGGRATGATAADMFLKSMRYIANLICECFNLYLIPNLVAYNFPTDQFPKMRVRNIGEVKDLQMWATAMANLITSGAITVDLETEQFIRNIVDFPSKIGDRPEFTPQQVKENILLQGIAPGQTQKALPPGQTSPGGVVLPPGAGTKPKGTTDNKTKSGNIGKSPTSGV